MLTVERLTVRPGKDDEYRAWMREAFLPFLSSEPGFLSSTAAREDGGGYLIVEKWTSREARERSLASEPASRLKAEAMRFVERRSEELKGSVVDVLRGRC